MDKDQSSNNSTFQFLRPQTVEEVFALMCEYGAQACLLAGGTDVLVRIRGGRTKPAVVIDLKQVRTLRADIAASDSTLEIGALATMAEILSDKRISRRFPALAEAAQTVGSVQIRNRATLAGNICNASPAADTVPALMVYGAVVNLLGENGGRSVPVAEFFVGPGTTVIRPNELVASVSLPLSREPVGASFDRLTRRRGVDLATVNVCCLVESSGVTRFAYGAVGPRPILVSDDSGRLSDPNGDRQAREAIISKLIEQTSPITDVRAGSDYRRAMLVVLSLRTLEAAMKRLRKQREGE